MTDPGFAGKVALITGSSRGIGRALALSLAQRGTSVVINYRANEDAARDTVAEIERHGAQAIAVRADLESPDDVQLLFDAAAQRFGTLDFYVSNAAASAFKPFMDLGLHHLERTFNLNVRAFVLGAQRAAGLMDGGGRIVVLSSYGSLRAYPTYANLGASKAAAEAWVRYMAAELAPRGINVNAVNGGLIDTDSCEFFYGTGRVAPIETVLAKIPKRRMGTAEEVAGCVRFLLSPEADYVTGTTLVVDGGLTAVAPPFPSDAVAGIGADEPARPEGEQAGTAAGGEGNGARREPAAAARARGRAG